MQNLPNILNRRTFILAAVVLGVLVLLGLGLQRLQGFQLVSSTPSGTSENQYSPAEFTFTQELAPTNNGVNQIVFSPSVQGTTIVSGKKVSFDPLEPYDSHQVYKVTLKGPTSKSGKVLEDIEISFRPTYVDPSKLPAKYQVPKEDNDNSTAYTAESISIGGSSALLAHGITSEQIVALQEDFYGYFVTNKQQHRNLELTNIVQHVAGPRSAAADNFTYNVVIDGKTAYLATMEYTLGSIRLVLANPQTKAVVFDSNTFDPDAAGAEDSQ